MKLTLESKITDIFPMKEEKELKAAYRRLAKKYHPDVSPNKDAEQLFIHLSALYSGALEGLKVGIVGVPTKQIELPLDTGKKLKITYFSENVFELGLCYVCNRSIIYLISEKHQKYVENYKTVLRGLKYANTEMEKEFSRYFPKIKNELRLATGEYVLVLEKDSTDFALQDVAKMYAKKNTSLGSKHLAWVISRLLNLACFLQYNGISHSGLTLGNCYISPIYHTISLVGWWYTTEIGGKLKGLPLEVYNLMPPKEKSDKISSVKLDIESIRGIGRRLSGDSTPLEIKNWLEKASSSDAFKEHEAWHQVLEKVWGARKFVELPLTLEDIYN